MDFASQLKTRIMDRNNRPPTPFTVTAQTPNDLGLPPGKNGPSDGVAIPNGGLPEDVPGGAFNPDPLQRLSQPVGDTAAENLALLFRAGGRGGAQARGPVGSSRAMDNPDVAHGGFHEDLRQRFGLGGNKMRRRLPDSGNESDY